jgi:hypothetical protein
VQRDGSRAESSHQTKCLVTARRCPCSVPSLRVHLCVHTKYRMHSYIAETTCKECIDALNRVSRARSAALTPSQLQVWQAKAANFGIQSLLVF